MENQNNDLSQIVQNAADLKNALSSLTIQDKRNLITKAGGIKSCLYSREFVLRLTQNEPTANGVWVAKKPDGITGRLMMLKFEEIELVNIRSALNDLALELDSLNIDDDYESRISMLPTVYTDQFEEIIRRMKETTNGRNMLAEAGYVDSRKEERNTGMPQNEDVLFYPDLKKFDGGQRSTVDFDEWDTFRREYSMKEPVIRPRGNPVSQRFHANVLRSSNVYVSADISEFDMDEAYKQDSAREKLKKPNSTFSGNPLDNMLSNPSYKERDNEIRYFKREQSAEEVNTRNDVSNSLSYYGRNAETSRPINTGRSSQRANNESQSIHRSNNGPGPSRDIYRQPSHHNESNRHDKIPGHKNRNNKRSSYRHSSSKIPEEPMEINTPKPVKRFFPKEETGNETFSAIGDFKIKHIIDFAEDDFIELNLDVPLIHIPLQPPNRFHEKEIKIMDDYVAECKGKLRPPGNYMPTQPENIEAITKTDHDIQRFTRGRLTKLENNAAELEIDEEIQAFNKNETHKKHQMHDYPPLFEALYYNMMKDLHVVFTCGDQERERVGAKEVAQICKTIQFLVESQCGYESKNITTALRRKLLQNAVLGGTIVKPFDPVPDDFSSRYPDKFAETLAKIEIVGTGLKTYADLAVKGIYPGDGGHIKAVEGEAVAIISPATHQTVVYKDKSGLNQEEKEYLIKCAKEVGNETKKDPFVSVEILKAEDKKNTISTTAEIPESIYKPQIPDNYDLNLGNPNSDVLNDREGKSVPSSRLSRLANFGYLGIGLASGAVSELTKRTLGMADVTNANSSIFMTPANAERIVETLCRVRGAALKMGQMLSIQDDTVVSAPLLEIFKKVRDNADFMPLRQVNKVMTSEFGEAWRDLFLEFNEKPFAAASIGQVHKATTKDGKSVAVKIQYPGVAEGIDSDINNLVSVLNFGGLFPKGMFIENFVNVARRELRMECDYKRELRAINAFRDFLKDSPDYYVPKPFPELSTRCVLTTELIEGKAVDKCQNEAQEVRDYVAEKFIEICLNEIFVWRFMQTDPNWSNFFIGKHPETGETRMILLDFGASRAYSKPFVDKYMRVIKAAYDGDRPSMLKHSVDIGFLTGYESKLMNDAHCDSISILGETLASTKPFDFSKQSVTKRIHDLIPVMLEHRLTSPPEEIYSLHRKLSGSYLLATHLKATVSCGPLFEQIWGRYQFGEDGSKEVDIETEVD
uniref:ABC1 domain-containing protein n=1 Tax=Rhabditophanes sp. KR3021 TaxID=114890 RepID=A0AC35TU63_9BILA